MFYIELYDPSVTVRPQINTQQIWGEPSSTTLTSIQQEHQLQDTPKQQLSDAINTKYLFAPGFKSWGFALLPLKTANFVKRQIHIGII